MKKRIRGHKTDQNGGMREAAQVLDVEHLAEVEVTSEDPSFPIEHALLPRHGDGWRASESGIQVIRLYFDEPQTVRRIYLHFLENEIERHQEFALRWGEKGDEPLREIVRQQWNFSPSGSQHEIEDYRVMLENLSVLELEIIPDTGGREARCSLQQFYLSDTSINRDIFCEG